MSTKLTLRLDEALISAAKKYAAHEGRSVSELVAAYFKRLDVPIDAASAKKDHVSTHRKSSFYGLLNGADITPKDIDKKSYLEHLSRKHQ